MTAKTPPEWVKGEVALAVHARQICEHGGKGGVRDHSALESALSRAQNAFTYSATCTHAHFAAHYAFGIVKNHPFIDGNKRTALVISQLFLKLNGYKINATQKEKYMCFIKLAAGATKFEQLAEWFKKHIKKE